MPFDILSRYKLFLPFNSSETGGGQKTCRDTLNDNLPALPRTEYTVSNTGHTTSGISSIPPAPLLTIPNSNWIKGNLSTKKNNKPIKLFVFEKKYLQYYLSFPEHAPKAQESGRWIMMLSPVWREADTACLISVSLRSISDTIPGVHHTLGPHTQYPAVLDTRLMKL